MTIHSDYYYYYYYYYYWGLKQLLLNSGGSAFYDIYLHIYSGHLSSYRELQVIPVERKLCVPLRIYEPFLTFLNFDYLNSSPYI